MSLIDKQGYSLGLLVFAVCKWKLEKEDNNKNISEELTTS